MIKKLNLKGRMIESDGQRMVYEGYQVPKQNEQNSEDPNPDQTIPNFDNFSQSNKVDHSKGSLYLRYKN